MALKDHSLDDKIITAAREEFLGKGYTGASLRKIAERAGVTVGAIQTRYRSKDDLFVSILRPFLNAAGALFQSTKTDYYAGAGTDFWGSLKISMQHESNAILHLIFAHYQEAVLLLCRSGGSSLEHYFDEIVQSKISESIAFFRKAGFIGIEERLLGFLIAAQFDSYRRIVTDCTDREVAEQYMDVLMSYHFGGWTALFSAADKSREEDSDEV